MWLILEKIVYLVGIFFGIIIATIKNKKQLEYFI